MRRIHFLAPDVESAKHVVDELLLARVAEKHIHVLAQDGVALEDLPEASFFQRSDLAHAIEQGLALGGASGAIAGLVAISLPTGLVLGGGAVLLATTLAGAGIGAWSATLKALDIPSSHLKQFEEELKNGKILIIVDVPKARVDDVRERIHRTHAEVLDQGVDRTIPHFP